ncbi:SRA stem-loop-interacting RNA-binding protein, mitochondrial [Armadillidium nasatum]|uniref:SRA stem-loop-interacting RNA-binding protein, mitochondrial n=1 Tax=Armadillidium nasatum TaxID=96803 RepID=A0A5N5TGS7_9CRUS|nr:SRA stem-loop-interacting RNA-binding protein, mitochondrial [Armadillidium nasatum]
MATRRFPRILVRNLPFTVSHQELREHFSQFGQVIQARVIFDKKTGFSQKYGFVRFAQDEHMKNALSKSSQFLDGSFIDVLKSNRD